MSERTLEYGTNSREDFFKVLSHVLINHKTDMRDMPGYLALTAEQRLGLKHSLDHFIDMVVQMAFLSSLGGGYVNPVHRPVVEQMMDSLQEMLDAMPAEEVKPEPVQASSAVESAQAAGAKIARQLIAAGACPLALRALCESMAPEPQPAPDMSAASTKLGRLLGKGKPEGMFHNA